MKDSDSSGSTNIVVAATTPSASSSSSSSSSNTSASVAPRQQPSGVSSSSLSAESCGLARWQCGTVRDPHSSSDTDDCDLDLGIGRLVIDLEADLDSKLLASCTEMKSSGIAQKSTTTSSTFAGISAASTATSSHGPSISVACNNSNDANVHLNRAAKVAPAATDALKSSSHRSLMKSVQPSSSFVPVSAVQGDLTDRGIKMRIKCSQSAQGSSSGGQPTKHETFPFHSPFLTSSVESTATAGATDFGASRVVGDRSAHGSTNLGKSNCSRSSHKKDRHSTKDRSKVTGIGRSFGDDLVLCNSSSGSSSSSSHSNCATVANKETVDVVPKSDASSGDGGPPKISTSSSDPYEFNMKTEDTVGLPVKKLKLDRCDASNSPILELSLPGVEKKDVSLDASHIGTITEPECLGPCEPGTSVTLEGIVWNETENGLLVVNVTWRGKTYVGTLMDSTKHHWAPPRFSGDSPTSDFETRTPKGRGKRGRTCAVTQRNEGNGSDRKLRSNRFSKPAPSIAAPSPVRNDGNSLKRARPDTSSSDGSRGAKCTRSDSQTSESTNGSAGAVGELVNGGMIECPEENCSKKYRNMNGLRYHQTRAHKLSCAALAKETNDLDASKYINDDFFENSTAVNRASQKSRNSATETSGSSARKSLLSSNKPVEAGGKTEESLEEIDSETKSSGDDVAAMEQELKEEHIANSECNVLTNADAGYKALGITAVEEPHESSRNRGCTSSFPLVGVDDSRNLGITHQPLVALTPLPVPPDGSGASFWVQPSVTATQSAVAVGHSDCSFTPGLSSPDELAPGDSARDRDKVKKPKAEKTDRGKLKTSSDGVLRPVVPVLTTPTTTVATAKPVILSPCLMLPSVSAQLKLIQPKPVLPAERTSLEGNLTALADKNKKRKRDKEKPKLESSVPCAAKPAAVSTSGAGSELSESDQLTSQNNTPTTFSGSVAATLSDSGIAQVNSSPATPVPISTDGFCRPATPLAPSSDQAPSGPQPEPCPVMGVLSSYVLHPANIADQPAMSQADTVAQNDSSGKTASSNNQATLSVSTLGNQHVLLPVENLNVRPVVSLQSSLKVVPSSVIKTASSFDANANLPVEPKPLSACDGEIPGQSVAMERKLSVLLPGTNNDLATKTDEPGAKPVPDGPVQPTSGLNLSSSASPCKKGKATGAKHTEADSVAEFVDPHSPAYSDISDANDNTPLLDAPMLEKEAQAAAEEETAGSKVSPNNTQDSYVYSPFYGQPPYLTPAVPSSDHSECGSVLKPPLTKPLLEKHQVAEKSKTEAVRSRANEIPMKFAAGEQPLRSDDKEPRDKMGRVMNSGPTHGTTRSDVHKSQQQQQHQPQHQPHKMFTGETVLPQHMTMMQHMIMPSTYAFSTPFGLFNTEYNENLQRLYQQQFLQQQEARRHDHATVSKPQVEAGGGDHGKSRSTVKASVEGKHSEEKFKPTKFEGMLPTPPSLIPDRNRHDPKEDPEKPDRSRDKQAEGRKPAKDGVEIKNMADAGVGIKREGFEMKMLAERQKDIPRYCLQPHFLEQQQQQRLSEQQSHKGAVVESGAGGCKPSAVVAPQTRDKIVSVGGMIGGAAAALHGTKQPRDDSQGRSHDNHRSHRDVQKNPSMTPPQQQQSLPQHKGSGSSRDGSAGRTPKEAGERPGIIKDDPGPSGSRGANLKGKEDTPMTSLPISMPPGIPAPYASYYSHYLPAAAYTGAMPFDPSHVYSGMIGYPGPPYIHPAQMLSPALAMASAEGGKPCDMIPQSHQPASFFANEGQPHKIHELKEVAKMQQQQGDSRSQPSPGNRDSTRPKSRSSGSHSAGKDNDHSSPPTQRHLHTHHHMHVVSPLYPYVHSDATLIATQQAAAATAATQLPRPFLAK